VRRVDVVVDRVALVARGLHRVRRGQSSRSAQSPTDAVVDRLAGLLPAEALEDAPKGLQPDQITGPGGLLTQLAGRVIETALGAELTEHLGHPPGGVTQGPNVRNGAGRKTVKTELGAVEVRTPRDRDGSFEPKLVAERQTRLAGLDDRILGLYAGGMSVRDIEDHLQGLYGVEIKRDTISRSPTPSLRTSPRGAPGRWTPSMRSRTSTA
jgi:putative transposase